MPETGAGDSRQDEGAAPAAWETLSSRLLGEYEMFSVRESRARPAGGGEAQTLHTVRSPGGVAVVALTHDGRLVLVEQFRHGTGRVALELPSGVSEPGESPLAAARRELREETGYEGADGELIGCLELNPSWQDTRVEVVLVRGAARTGPQQQDELEDIRVCLLAPGELRERMRKGEVTSAAAVGAFALWAWRGCPGARSG
jgi:8-oxo-dGTP pyrophosphatase MutT (NUDIX family)